LPIVTGDGDDDDDDDDNNNNNNNNNQRSQISSRTSSCQEDKQIYRSDSRLLLSSFSQSLLKRSARSMSRLNFLNLLAKKISQQSGDERETTFFISTSVHPGATIQ